MQPNRGLDPEPSAEGRNESVGSVNESTRARALVELIERLGRIAHLRGFHAGLNPAQWAALRFLARANRSVRTTTGFARANGTTQGTATQTISALVNKGLVRRDADLEDRRIVRLDLTDAGRVLLGDDPLNLLVDLVAKIPLDRALSFARELAELNQQLADVPKGKESPGSCGLLSSEGS